MANLTAQRDTKALVTPFDFFGEFPLTTGVVIFKGAAVGFDSAGKICKGATSGNIAPAGRAEHNSNPAGAVAGDTMKFRCGIHLWDASGTNVPTIANRYAQAYFEDDHTVGTLATAHLLAGIIWDVTTAGVWVITTPPFIAHL